MEGHFIASSDVALKLTLPASSDEVLRVLIHRRPEESALPDFGLSAEGSIVASVWCRVALFDDFLSFGCWYTPPQKPVGTDPIQVWVIPKVSAALNLQLLPAFAWWYVTRDHVVDDGGVPRVQVSHS